MLKEIGCLLEKANHMPLSLWAERLNYQDLIRNHHREATDTNTINHQHTTTT